MIGRCALIIFVRGEDDFMGRLSYQIVKEQMEYPVDSIETSIDFLCIFIFLDPRSSHFSFF
jgi:hypothetical protein